MTERRSPNRVVGGDPNATAFSVTNGDVNSGIAYVRVGLLTMSP